VNYGGVWLDSVATRGHLLPPSWSRSNRHGGVRNKFESEPSNPPCSRSSRELMAKTDGVSVEDRNRRLRCAPPSSSDAPGDARAGMLRPRLIGKDVNEKVNSANHTVHKELYEGVADFDLRRVVSLRGSIAIFAMVIHVAPVGGSVFSEHTLLEHGGLLAEPACVINRQRCAHLVSGPFTELDHEETIRVSYFEGRVSGGLQS
jgi:hypothetical protein